MITERQQILNNLQNLPVSSLANGPTLASELENVEQVSLQSDQDYSAWASDVETTGCTGTSAPQDSNYAAANNASAQATVTKQTFLNDFNPIAAQYGLQQWTTDQI